MATKTKKAAASKTSSKAKSTAKPKALKAKKTNGKAIAKSRADDLFPAFPSFRSLIDSFWDTDNFFGKDMESFFKRAALPAVNIKDNTKTYEVSVGVPGLGKEDINITVENGLLRIKGEKEASKESKGDNFTRKEYSYNNFERTFTLPENANPDSIKASYKNGELKIKLAKTAAKKKSAKKVKIA